MLHVTDAGMLFCTMYEYYSCYGYCTVRNLCSDVFVHAA
jgi:hypothetical protein